MEANPLTALDPAPLASTPSRGCVPGGEGPDSDRRLSGYEPANVVLRGDDWSGPGVRKSRCALIFLSSSRGSCCSSSLEREGPLERGNMVFFPCRPVVAGVLAAALTAGVLGCGTSSATGEVVGGIDRCSGLLAPNAFVGGTVEVRRGKLQLAKSVDGARKVIYPADRLERETIQAGHQYKFVLSGGDYVLDLVDYSAYPNIPATDWVTVVVDPERTTRADLPNDCK
jgi:hypothetical protein